MKFYSVLRDKKTVCNSGITLAFSDLRKNFCFSNSQRGLCIFLKRSNKEECSNQLRVNDLYADSSGASSLIIFMSVRA